jgi:hypothetical protein
MAQTVVTAISTAVGGCDGTDWGDSNKYSCWWRNTGGKRQMESLGIDGKLVLKYILQKQDGRAGALLSKVVNWGFQKCGGFCD